MFMETKVLDKFVFVIFSELFQSAKYIVQNSFNIFENLDRLPDLLADLFDSIQTLVPSLAFTFESKLG